jgi:glycosyltransferase involved in cell wall biosynthesis
MKVTRSAAEVRRELGISPQQRIIGIVGNIKAWKGQEVVIRAMSELKDRHPDVICLLIGDSSPQDSRYRASLEALVRHFDLDGRVVITGFRTDVANYVHALEILVHASVNPEPFGRVLLEGMALGKPLVASGGGAVPEIVVDGVTGLLFDPGSPTSLARSLEQLLSDPSRAAMMGVAGRRRLEAEFSIENNIRATQRLYRAILTA